MKRGLVISIVLLVFLTTIVSASLFDARGGSQKLVEVLQDSFGPALSVLFGSTEYIFEKFLFFLIMVVFIYAVLNKIEAFEGKPGVIWVIAFCVSILSTRFLTEFQTFYGVILPYSSLGVALTAVIPFIIYFTFVESFESATLRKILWIFFLVAFYGLAWIRRGELGDLAWIYFLTGIVATVMLFADGTIRRAMRRMEIKQLELDNREGYEREIRRHMDRAREDYDNRVITDSQYKRIMRGLRKRLKSLRKL
ncbi:MAG: hypothetical protein ABIE22_04635 [archaeon]